MSEATIHHVFVYGTLKRGFWNHHRLESGSNFIGSAITQQKYPLYVKGLPFLVNKPNDGFQIRGELYEVDDAKLQDLDRLEGHPNFYRRQKVTVLIGEKQYRAWIYFVQGYSQEFGGEMVAEYKG